MEVLAETAKSPAKTAKQPLRVCFVCTGNTCRSPMAAALLNDMARIPEICSMCDMEKILGAREIHAVSRGLAATGEPISQNAVRALEEAGIASLPDNAYKNHISMTVDGDTLGECDLIVGISGSHAMRLMTMFPEYATKITSLPRDIPDPFGGNLRQYKTCLEEIRAGIEQMFFGKENQ